MNVLYQLKSKITLLAFVIMPLMAYAQGPEACLMIPSSSVFAHHSLGELSLLYDNESFAVIKNKEVYKVDKCWVDKSLQNVSAQKVKTFLKHGYICVNQLDSGEFVLRTKVRGIGGGPVCAYWVYMTTKAICYGTATAAVTTALVATGGTAAGAIATSLGASAATTATVTAATTAVAEVAVTLGTGTNILVNGGAAIGTTLVSGALTSTAATAAIGTTVAATTGAAAQVSTLVTVSMGTSGAMATIELGSLFIGSFFLVPWLP